jgi:hypothetical protein
MKSFSEFIYESKSGDSSLRDWFGKSSSSDGTPGWVQLGGKYAGKPCAKQPGQTTKPKCGSSKMKSNLNKDEEERAFSRKNRQDGNPDRKGKAKNVATEETVLEKAGEKDACYKKVKSRYRVWPSAYASGALVKCRKVGASNWGNKTKKEDFSSETSSLVERYTKLQERGKTYHVRFQWRGKYMDIQIFFPSLTTPTKMDVSAQIKKIYPGSTVISFSPNYRDPTQPLLHVGE